MLKIELKKEIEQRLTRAAEKRGKSRESVVAEAIADLLQDEEDYDIAVARLNDPQPALPLDELGKRLGLAD